MLFLIVIVIKLDNKFLDFQLITQEGILVSDQVKKVKVKTSMGGLTILPNHAEIKSDLVPGTMKISYYDDSKEEQKFNIADGVIEASPSKVTIITRTAKVKEDKDPYQL